MFLKVVLMFSCLVVCTITMPILEKAIMIVPGLVEPEKTNQITCSESFIPTIDFTHISNMKSKVQDTFYQISNALSEANCTGPKMEELQQLLDEVKGTASLQLAESSTEEPVETFWERLRSYITSLHNLLRGHFLGDDVA